MNESLDIRKIKAKQALTAPQEVKNQEKTSGFWEFLNRDIQLGNALSDRIKESFYLDLCMLLQAGVDIRTALELIKDEQKSKRAKAIFSDVLTQVVAGSTLSGALKKNKQFSGYEYFSVQIGEETGKLNQVLKELSSFFQKKIKQRRQVIGALTYPMVVLTVAFGAVSFMITYVVPMFSDIFKRFGNDLPAVTKFVITLSGIFRQFFGPFFIILIILVVLLFSQRKKPWFRKLSSALLLRTPVVGLILQKIYLSRFANTMALLVGSKIPIVQAIQLTKKMITFYPIESSLEKIEKEIINGGSLNKSLAEHSIYPQRMISMIKVGEEVNQLEVFFTRISEHYANEVEHQANLLNKFLEPLIIIILGLVVGVVLIAMYLPLFKLGQNF